MIVAVLDTNVLASGFIGLNFRDSIPGELLRRWRGKSFLLVVSEPILAELARAFDYPYFVQRLSASEIEAAFAELRTAALIQPITEHVSGIASHAQDDEILATALSAGAPYLVTGDKPLLRQRAFRGALLLSPRQFLDVLDQQGNE